MENTSVLFLPIINWEFRRQRPQHLASCFARAGYTVFYPDLRLQATPGAPVRLEAGLWRIALAGNPDLDPYRDRMSENDVEVALPSFCSLGQDHNLTGLWIVAQLPFWRPLAERLRDELGGRLIFDCMDDFGGFSDHDDFADEESALARAADLVSVSSQALYAKHVSSNPRTHLVRNACQCEHFAPLVKRAPVGEPPVVGFFGGIHDWFDNVLVEELAQRNPGWEFHLIGDTYLAEVQVLRTLPNVVFLGERPYPDLPHLVASFDVGLIPFKRTLLTQATNPVKVYEMLSAGLPVVAVDLPELRRLEPYVSIGKSAEDFSNLIQDALAEPPEARVWRSEFARQHSWDSRFLELRRAMDEIESGAPARPPAQEPDSCYEPENPQAYKAYNKHLLATLGSVGDQLACAKAELGTLREELESLRSEVETYKEEQGALMKEQKTITEQRDALARELASIHSSRWWRVADLYWSLHRRLRGDP